MHNIGKRDASTQPKMLARFIWGVICPLICVGCTIEFGLGIMAVEREGDHERCDKPSQTDLDPSPEDHIASLACIRDPFPLSYSFVARCRALIYGATLSNG